MKRSLLLLALALGQAFSTSLRATDGNPVWTNLFNGAANNDDRSRALAVDGVGNVIVTGTTSDSNGCYDFATIKYSSAGIGLWTNLFNGPGNGDDTPAAVAVDGCGSVYVTGRAHMGTGINWDYVTIKYSGGGAALWTNFFGGPGQSDDGTTALAVAGNGSVYVTGHATGLGTGHDFATVKYSGAGVALWTNIFGSFGEDGAKALGLDALENVYVTGDATGIGTGSDVITLKYSSTGTALWTNSFDGAGANDQAVALRVDEKGDVLVAAMLREYVLNIGALLDYATIKYSSSGTALWTNRFDGAGHGEDYLTALAVNAAGDVYVTGRTTGIGSSWDYGTLKYSSSGLPIRTNVFDGAGTFNDFANALSVDATGNFYVTGNSDGGGSGDDSVTIKYSNDGMALWTNRFSGPGNEFDSTSAVAIDGSGSVYVTGTSYGSGTSSDFLTIKYSGTGDATNRPPSIALQAGKPGPNCNTLTMAGNQNTSYLLQFTMNLTSGQWLTLSTNISNMVGSWTVIDATATNAQRFYRVSAL